MGCSEFSPDLEAKKPADLHSAASRNHTETKASRKGRNGRRDSEEKILLKRQDSEPLCYTQI